MRSRSSCRSARTDPYFGGISSCKSSTPASSSSRFAAARAAAMSCEKPGKAVSSASDIARLAPGRSKPQTYLSWDALRQSPAVGADLDLSREILPERDIDL
jgi:hypothetical protein